MHTAGHDAYGFSFVSFRIIIQEICSHETAGWAFESKSLCQPSGRRLSIYFQAISIANSRKKMATNLSFFFPFFFFFFFLAGAHPALSRDASIISSLGRKSFPRDFIFGTASASYQYEGAAAEGGRGPSIWDTFTHQHPEKIKEGANGDIAVDQYHRYKEDVRLMKDLGLDAYRFSISWSRILPNGKVSGGINKEGVAYYNNLINYLLSRGLKPFVTLFHWDLPQALESEYGGFLSARIIEDYTNFAEVCFRAFGDRVKHWITLNEPWTYARGGYVLGTFAPGRCTKILSNCTAGNSGTEPYVVGHNMLLAHANAVKLYKTKYQKAQKGEIGITLVSHWFVPHSTSSSDAKAAQRALDFMLGWFLDPLGKGDYPKSMRLLVSRRLPRFTKEEAQLVKGSYDFLGMNYYTANYASNFGPNNTILAPSYTTDSRAILTGERNGVLIGRLAASPWLYMYPKGIKNLLVYIKNKYNNPKIFITENGYSEFKNNTLPLMEALKDPWRIEYYSKHLYNLREAISEGVDVKGYFAWSLLDNFEWADGYSIRFGLVFIDYKNGLKRHPKHSAYWLQKFLRA